MSGWDNKTRFRQKVEIDTTEQLNKRSISTGASNNESHTFISLLVALLDPVPHATNVTVVDCLSQEHTDLDRNFKTTALQNNISLIHRACSVKVYYIV